MWYVKGKERDGAWRWDEMSDAFVRQYTAVQSGAEQVLRRRDRRRSAFPRRRADPDGRSLSFGAPRARSPPPRRRTRSPPPPLQRQAYPPSQLPSRPRQTWSPSAPAPDRTQGGRHEWSNSPSPPYLPPPPSSDDAGPPISNPYPPYQHIPAGSWPAAAAAAVDPSAPSTASSLRGLPLRLARSLLLHLHRQRAISVLFSPPSTLSSWRRCRGALRSLSALSIGGGRARSRGAIEPRRWWWSAEYDEWRGRRIRHGVEVVGLKRSFRARAVERRWMKSDDEQYASFAAVGSRSRVVLYA